MQKSNIFNRFVTCNVLVLLALAVGVSPCWSQTTSADRNWASEPWTENDVPYRRIRDGIDQRIARGEDAAAIAFNFEKQQSNPFDTKAQFQWAYTAFKSLRGPGETDSDQQQKDEQTLVHIIMALQRASSATARHSYEYSRLRFMAEASIAGRKLKPLGERLLERNPQDLDVMFWQVLVLDPETHREDKAPSLSYARTLIQAQPKNSRFGLLLGHVYFKMWRNRVKHHSIDEPSMARQTIAAYNQVLQVVPPNYPYRKDIQKRIDDIRQVRLRFKNHSRR